MKRKIVEICDGDYSRLWYDPQVVPSNHPTYLVIKMDYMDQWCSDFEHTYHMEIMALGPRWPSKKNLEERLRDYEMSRDDFKALPLDGQLQILAETGLAAHLWQQSGNNKRTLLNQAREELSKIQVMFGFYMDRYQNQIGDTGWDWIRGNLMAGMKRRQSQAV